MGKLGLLLMGGAMLSKSLIQFSVDGWGCISSLLCTWGQTIVEVMKIMETSFKGPMHAVLHSVLTTLHQATGDPHPSAGAAWTLLGKSESVSCGVTAPFSWILVKSFCLHPPRVRFPSPVKVLVILWWG